LEEIVVQRIESFIFYGDGRMSVKLFPSGPRLIASLLLVLFPPFLPSGVALRSCHAAKLLSPTTHLQRQIEIHVPFNWIILSVSKVLLMFFVEMN
jgi:hypothetical protein